MQLYIQCWRFYRFLRLLRKSFTRTCTSGMIITKFHLKMLHISITVNISSFLQKGKQKQNKPRFQILSVSSYNKLCIRKLSLVRWVDQEFHFLSYFLSLISNQTENYRTEQSTASINFKISVGIFSIKYQTNFTSKYSKYNFTTTPQFGYTECKKLTEMKLLQLVQFNKNKSEYRQ
jgi:hypothetical protein